MGYFWSEEELNRRLEEIMKRAFASALLVSCAKEVNIRMAPLDVGIKRVPDVSMQREGICKTHIDLKVNTRLNAGAALMSTKAAIYDEARIPFGMTCPAQQFFSKTTRKYLTKRQDFLYFEKNFTSFVFS